MSKSILESSRRKPIVKARLLEAAKCLGFEVFMYVGELSCPPGPGQGWRSKAEVLPELHAGGFMTDQNRKYITKEIGKLLSEIWWIKGLAKPGVWPAAPDNQEARQHA